MRVMGTYSFLDTIRLEGRKPNEALHESQSVTFISSASLLPFATSLLFECRERMGRNRGNPLVGLLYQLRADTQQGKVVAGVDKIVNHREGHLGKIIETMTRDIRAWGLRTWRRGDRRASRR